MPRGRVDGRRTIPIGKPEDVPSEIAAVTADRDTAGEVEPAASRRRPSGAPSRSAAGREGSLEAAPATSATAAPPAAHRARAHRRPPGPICHVGRRARASADPDRRPVRGLAPCRRAVREVDLRNVRSGGASAPGSAQPPSSSPRTRRWPCPRQTDEPLPHPRRPDGARGVAADPQGLRRRGGQLPNFLGVLAGSPAALRGYVRFRAELRHGALCRGTAPSGSASRSPTHYGSKPGLRCTPAPRAARASASTRSPRASDWDSGDAARGRDAALSAPVAGRARDASRSTCTRRRARPAGRDEQLLEAIARSPWNPSRRWSTSPARSPWTAPWRRRGCCAPHTMSPRRSSRPEVRRGPASHRARTEAATRPRAAARGGVQAEPAAASAAPASTRRSSSSASAGPARSSTCCCRAVADALHGDRPGGARTLSDRLLSERMKELEARGIVERHVSDGTPDQGRVRADADGPRARPALASSRRGRTAGWTESDLRPTVAAAGRLACSR